MAGGEQRMINYSVFSVGSYFDNVDPLYGELCREISKLTDGEGYHVCTSDMQTAVQGLIDGKKPEELAPEVNTVQ